MFLTDSFSCRISLVPITSNAAKRDLLASLPLLSRGLATKKRGPNALGGLCNKKKKKTQGGKLWSELIHQGPLLAPTYVRLPDSVKLYYDGKPIDLSPATEEIATLYAKVTHLEYTHKKIFNDNFFKDWRDVMTDEEREIIQELSKCDFEAMNRYYMGEREKKLGMRKEEKLRIKEEKAQITEMFGHAVVDGNREKIGNFSVEPPSLFRGRGDHPKMGKLKRRVLPEDIMINIGKGAPVPEPPEGHKWKEVIHDPSLAWLASWKDTIQPTKNKYVYLNTASKFKSFSDLKKFENARKLKRHIGTIRKAYSRDMNDECIVMKQKATATYLVDKLAIRIGNEKDSDEQADTVGCCSLRVEHVEMSGPQTVKFDFIGKDYIRYQNETEVVPKAFDNLELFTGNKPSDALIFDSLTPQSLNKYLQSLMPGLTTKVFRTFNASVTLFESLKKIRSTRNLESKLWMYNAANRDVAVLCNHKKAISKTHVKQLEDIDAKIVDFKSRLKQAKRLLRELKRKDVCDRSKTEQAKVVSIEKKIQKLNEKIETQGIRKSTKEESKDIAIVTSKVNYLDPRITVAWAKKHDIPIEKLYNKTERERFAWAMNVNKTFKF
eukprot:Nk52_evm71s352 gene=Nk52_evmTU71s352